ncbi:uncharacterized protein TRIADDRAFT_38221 [Trichoplax adhaerens]|uniref:glutathione transferase n=1 Tax=Trichoplax adhaerens TaxID=10228 RepID=B3S7I0_TRIAD|nr:hypothetical protein TRIADDRAFT_38221 [Trichoplax adhaerens]EDV21294.1 hypothetical protein TRIADDRAFT_38221 [Trichoplax adhaerens]|eukprot:XP_002116261.1 hypothetical protein TRIADDRAFT_38221 [Trichoplax adhaerens]
MPAITLHYFNLAARGETIRLIFAAGGVDYKDLRYEQENWPTLKASLAGKTSIEQAVADQVADCFLHDLLDKFIAFTFEKDETKKEQIKTTYTTEIIPFYLGKLEKILQENGGQYFAGSLTYADIAFYRFANVVKDFFNFEEAAKKFPKLTALYQRIANLPNIRKWEESKPKNHVPF